jgi:hypothetical protein
LVVWRLLLRRRLPRGRVLRRTLPQLALPRLRALHVPPRLLERQQLIRRLRLIRLARCPRLRGLLQLHQRLQLRLPLHVPELLLLLLRRVLACRCGLRQHREARLREHVLRRHRLGLRVLLAHLQQCNAIQYGREGLVLRRDNLVLVRRKACARPVERRNNIVRAARRRAVLVVRQGSVRVDRLRVSRNVLVAAVDQAAATIKDR